VLRGGAGYFYDRTGPGPIQDLIRYDGNHLLRYVITDPGYPNPVQPGQGLGVQPISTVVLEPGTTIPFLLHYGAGIERQVLARTTLAVNFVGTRGFDAFRSIDINAPPPPAFTIRPDPSMGIVRQIQSAGRTDSQSVQVTVRGWLTRFFNGSIEYTYARAHNDTSGVNWMPPNNYDLSLEYARADFNQLHRLEMFGTIPIRKTTSLGLSASLATGRPYSLTTGAGHLQRGNGEREAGRRPPQQPGRSRLRQRGRAFLARLRPRDGQRSSTRAHGRRGCLQRPEPCELLVLCRQPELSVFREAVSSAPARRIQFSLRFRY
jgi:hypothetical protein